MNANFYRGDAKARRVSRDEREAKEGANVLVGTTGPAVRGRLGEASLPRRRGLRAIPKW